MRRLLRIPRAIAGAVVSGVRAIVEPLRPEAGTTEAGLYFGLVLVALCFLAAGDVPKALGVPGAVITFLSSAPVLAGLRKAA